MPVVPAGAFLILLLELLERLFILVQVAEAHQQAGQIDRHTAEDDRQSRGP